MSFTKEEKAELVSSIRRFFDEKLEEPISEMHAGFLLEYIELEIAPLAYNRGVADARAYLQQRVEELPGSCFEEPMRYWAAMGNGREVRRKPGG